MTEQPRFDDSSELVPHRNFTIPFNYVWERESARWIPMEEGFGGSYLDNITFNASAFIHKFGSNPEIKNSGLSVASPETIWDGSNEYTFPSDDGEIMEIASSNGTDTQDVVVQGLDENFLDKTWTGTLAGTTPVNIGTWTRIFRAYNDGNANFVGDITINEVGGSTDYLKILDGNNQTLMAIYTIPADKIGYLTRYSLSAQNEQSSSSIHFTAQIRTREFGKVFRVREIVSFGTSHDTERVLQFPTKLQPKTDIIFNVVNSDGNNGSVNADFDIALHDLN
jgi:hypothetical protein